VTRKQAKAEYAKLYRPNGKTLFDVMVGNHAESGPQRSSLHCRGDGDRAQRLSGAFQSLQPLVVNLRYPGQRPDVFAVLGDRDA
jgi:hypothetical protein